MIKGLYGKLIVNSWRKNKQVVLPFVLSGMFMVAVYYIIYSLSLNPGLVNLPKGGASVAQLLGLATYIVGGLSVVFFLYTYSFLIKRRMKELATYSVLGMSKTQLLKLLFIEIFGLMVLILGLGLVIGIVFDKLFFMLLLRIMSEQVYFGFYISWDAIKYAFILFSGIGIVLLLFTTCKILRLNIIRLLKEESVNEKQPKANWLLVLIGFAALGYGYYTALTVVSPLKALVDFFYAVIAVIIGTYCLFMAITILVLKMMKNNKKYYYVPKHFISVSNMLFRMKRNAVGLANVCVLSTMVLVTMTVTVNLYVGQDILIKRYSPKDVGLSVHVENFDQVDSISSKTKQILESNQIEVKNFEVQKKLTFFGLGNILDNQYYIETIKESPSIEVINRMATFEIITLDSYRQKQPDAPQLDDDEVILYSTNKNINAINSGEVHLTVKDRMNKEIADTYISQEIFDTYLLVVKDEAALFDVRESVQNQENEFNMSDTELLFNFNTANEQQINKAKQVLNDRFENGFVNTVVEVREQVGAPIVGLLFIGSLISLVFMVFVIVITYYKQLSEAYEDKQRFKIMQQVGLQSKQIKQSINSQVLFIFFMPLVVAAIHVVASSTFTTKILLLFGLNNRSLFITTMMTILLVFILVYGLIFRLTSKVYYKIVKA